MFIQLVFITQQNEGRQFISYYQKPVSCKHMAYTSNHSIYLDVNLQVSLTLNLYFL
jgi:hypothetical protein